MNTNIPAPNPSSSKDELGQIKKDLAEQKEILLELYKQSQKTKRYILVGRIISFVYLILIIAPIIFAIIYLPPFIEKTMAPYNELINQSQEINNLDVDSINDILKRLK